MSAEIGNADKDVGQNPGLVADNGSMDNNIEQNTDHIVGDTRGDGKPDTKPVTHFTGYSVDVGFNHNSTAVLHAVMEWKDVGVVQKALDRGADVNSMDGLWWTPLIKACSQGHAESVRILLEHGAKPNPETPRSEGYLPYRSPLQAAVTSGSVECVKLLIRHGADLDAWGGSHGNALFAALSLGHLDCAKALLQAGASLDKYFGESTALMEAARCSVDSVKLVLETTWKRSLPATEASEAVLVLDETLEGSAEVALKCKEATTLGTALHKAAKHDRPECIQYLTRMGSDVNARDKCGLTPLMVAAQLNHHKCVKVLLTAKADVCAFKDTLPLKVSPNGSLVGTALVDICMETFLEPYDTALMHAMTHESDQCVELLIKARGSRDHEHNAKTHLLHAASLGNLDYIRLLLQNELQLPVPQRVQLPMPTSEIERLDALLRASSVVRAKCRLRKQRLGTVLHAAAAAGHVECLKFFVAIGDGEGHEKKAWNNWQWAEVVDENHMTPLMLAAQKGRAACVNVLLERYDYRKVSLLKALAEVADNDKRSLKLLVNQLAL